MLVPIILGSDKTTASVMTGNIQFYPLYLSIGNIHNNVRRAHRSGFALVAVLSIPKSMCYFSFKNLQSTSTTQPTNPT